MSQRTRALPIVAASMLILAAPVGAQSPAASGGAPPPMTLPDGWTMVVGGLDSPRGLAVTADGTIYVAESGEGGTDPCVDHPELGNLCFGPTGGLSEVTDGTATRVVGRSTSKDWTGPSGPSPAGHEPPRRDRTDHPLM